MWNDERAAASNVAAFFLAISDGQIVFGGTVAGKMR